MFAALCDNYEFFWPRTKAVVLIAPIVRCKKAKMGVWGAWLGDKMLEKWKEESPEILN